MEREDKLLPTVLLKWQVCSQGITELYLQKDQSTDKDLCRATSRPLSQVYPQWAGEVKGYYTVKCEIVPMLRAAPELSGKEVASSPHSEKSEYAQIKWVLPIRLLTFISDTASTLVTWTKKNEGQNKVPHFTEVYSFFQYQANKIKMFLVLHMMDAISLTLKIASWLHWAATSVKSLMKLGDRILKKNLLTQYNHQQFFCYIKILKITWKR